MSRGINKVILSAIIGLFPANASSDADDADLHALDDFSVIVDVELLERYSSVEKGKIPKIGSQEAIADYQSAWDRDSNILRFRRRRVVGDDVHGTFCHAVTTIPVEELIDVAGAGSSIRRWICAQQQQADRHDDFTPYQQLRASPTQRMGFGGRSRRLDAMLIDFRDELRPLLLVREFSGDAFLKKGEACKELDLCSGTVNEERGDRDFRPILPFASARDLAWGAKGWFAFTSPSCVNPHDQSYPACTRDVLENNRTHEKRLHVRVGHVPSLAIEAGRPDPEKLRTMRHLVLCGVDFARRTSVEPNAIQQRHLAVFGFSTTRARVVFQAGIDPARSQFVDEDLLVVDICLDHRKEKYRRCSVGHTDAALTESCPEYDLPPDLLLKPDQQRSFDGITVDASFQSLPEGDGWEGAPSFSPDGRWLAYLRFDRTAHPICNGNLLGCGAKEGESDESAERDLWLIRNTKSLDDLVSGRPVNLTASFDWPVVGYRWSCEGGCLLVLVLREGLTQVHQLDIEQRFGTGDPVPDILAWQRLDNDSDSVVFAPLTLSSGADEHGTLVLPYIKDFLVSRSGRTIFPVVSSMGSFTERIYRCDRPEAHARQPFSTPHASCKLLTRPGKVSGILVRRIVKEEETVDRKCWESAGDWSGARCGFVFLPPGFLNASPGKKFPVLFYLHGGPHGVNTTALSNLIYPLVKDNGMVVVAPNPTGSSSFGEAYRRAVVAVADDSAQPSEQIGGWGGQAYQDVVRLITAFAEKNIWRDEDGAWASASDRFDTDAFYVMGASYGGYLVNLLLTRWNPSVGGKAWKLKGGVSMFGVFDLAGFPCGRDHPDFPGTDQQWFANFQFRSHLTGPDKCKPTLYNSLHDPADRLREAVREAKKSGKRWQSASMKRLLVIHGDRDFRVPFWHSKVLAAALTEGVRSNSPYTERIPFEVCKGQDTGHGFDHGSANPIHRAISSWMACDGKADCDPVSWKSRLKCGKKEKEEWVKWARDR